MRVQALAIAILAMAMCLSSPLQAQNPTVEARILMADEDFTSYMPLSGATVTILVDGDRFDVKTLKADSSGFVRFDVPLSTSFSLVFQGGGDRMPQMTSLAGQRNSENLVHVCLFTLQEYLGRYGSKGREKVNSDVRSMLLEIGRVRSEMDGENAALAMLERNLRGILAGVNG